MSFFRSNVVCKARSMSARIGLAIVGGFAALILISGPSAKAASNAASGSALSAVGSVDIQKIIAGYNKNQSAQDDMKRTADQMKSWLDIQQASSMLSLTDQQQLGTLLAKPDPTPADQAQIKTLQTKSQSDAAELTTLQQKQNMTDADKARLAQLTQEQQAGGQALQSIVDSYKQQLDNKNQQVTQVLENDIRTAVANVAQQKGLAVVFDSSLAIYASNDITQAVINKLNDGK